MCTVSFLPLSDGGYIITSTRDEKIVRKPANHPAMHELKGIPVYFPQDQQALGTWIAASAEGSTLCLLNGGLKIHTPSPPYKKSRGLVLLDLISSSQDIFRAIETYHFDGIEPFTLIAVHHKQAELWEFRWDGSKLHQCEKSYNNPHIWSSVTLYSSDVIQARADWFRLWLQEQNEFSMEKILNFHMTAGSGDIRNDIRMNRDDETKTVSITCVQVSENDHFMHYEDLTTLKSSDISISIS